MAARCVACGAPAQPDIDYCLECDVELCEQFAQARDYTDERDTDRTDTRAVRCADPAQRELEF